MQIRQELKCVKLSTDEICQAHRSEEYMKFVSYMCPLIATPEKCINREHSEMDHERKDNGQVVNFLTRLRHKEAEGTKEDVSEDEGFSKDVGEGWSYDTRKSVMRLTQRTTQQMHTLTPTKKIRAKRNLADRDFLEILLYCEMGSCLNMISQAKARKDGMKIKQGHTHILPGMCKTSLLTSLGRQSTISLTRTTL